MKHILSLSLLILILWLIGTQPALATDAVVGTGTPASCTEATFNTAFNTVKNSGGGTLTFNCGGAATIVFTTSKIILTNTNITIDGGTNITLSGADTTRHFYIEANANLTVKNITLQNGYDNTFGGGSILNLGELNLDNTTIMDSNVDSGHSGGGIFSYGPVTIINSLLENNTGGSVGGLFLFGETATGVISGTTFRNNRTTNPSYGLGGAITIWNGADVTVQQSILEQNEARYGGAIYNEFASGAILVEQDTVIRDNIVTERGGGIYSTGGVLTISDVIFDNNQSVDRGGGFNCENCQVSVTNSQFQQNDANLGGGLRCFNCQLNIDNSLFQHNSATNVAGGIEIFQSDATISRSQVISNTAIAGGGIYAEGAYSVLLQDSVVLGNQASSGGGMYTTSNTTNVHVSRVTFARNEAINGGAIYFNANNVVLIDHSTFSGNSATQTGGAIAIGHAPLVINHMTFVDNVAMSGNSLAFQYTSSIVVALYATILADGSGDNCVVTSNNVFQSQGYNIATDGSCFLTATGDLPNTNPMLGTLANNGSLTQTHLPLLGSPAIDGTTETGIGHDQRTALRPTDGDGVGGATWDIGAVEVQGVMATPVLSGTLFSGIQLVLDWNTGQGVCGYGLYYDSVPYFVPDSGHYMDEVGWMPAFSNTTTVPKILGYYQLVADGCANPDQNSNQVGIFEFAIVPGS
jgi:predicted outer membrane repeat protein